MPAKPPLGAESACAQAVAPKKAKLSPKWRTVFLTALAETSNVKHSCDEAGASASHVYAQRRKDPDFARRWMVALCEGYDHLEMELLSRLRDGEPREDARKYEYAAAMRLLAAHRESAAAERALRDNEDAEAILASIDAKLDAMRERDEAAKAVEAEPPAPGKPTRGKAPEGKAAKPRRAKPE